MQGTVIRFSKFNDSLLNFLVKLKAVYPNHYIISQFPDELQKILKVNISLPARRFLESVGPSCHLLFAENDEFFSQAWSRIPLLNAINSSTLWNPQTPPELKKFIWSSLQECYRHAYESLNGATNETGSSALSNIQENPEALLLQVDGLLKTLEVVHPSIGKVLKEFMEEIKERPLSGGSMEQQVAESQQRLMQTLKQFPECAVLLPMLQQITSNPAQIQQLFNQVQQDPQLRQLMSQHQPLLQNAQTAAQQMQYRIN